MWTVNENKKLCFNNKPIKQLKGISMTGFETGTRGTNGGAGYWLFKGANLKECKDIMNNIADKLINEWGCTIVRIPICLSAWKQNYNVRTFDATFICNYQDWINYMIQALIKAKSDIVIIIDGHLWALNPDQKTKTLTFTDAQGNKQTIDMSDQESCLNSNNNVGGVKSCSDKYNQAWETCKDNDIENCSWECAIANADGCTLESFALEIENMKEIWSSIASKYNDNSNIWFEIFNEPYERKIINNSITNYDETEYRWDLWYFVMKTIIDKIRNNAKANNICILGGLDFGYDFNPNSNNSYFTKTFNSDTEKLFGNFGENIMFNFHPYMHGVCCGQIADANGIDISITDKYESAYCSFYPNDSKNASGSSLPIQNTTCDSTGYSETVNKKMPPCTWVDSAHNPNSSSLGLCAGDRDKCNKQNTKEECNQNSDIGGWSEYVLKVQKYGPLIMTEFGSFDCSTPYVTRLLEYAKEHDISWTAWALWPQNSGGPGNGACGYPSIMQPYDDDTAGFSACIDKSNCNLTPLGFYGKNIQNYIKQNIQSDPNPPNPNPDLDPTKNKKKSSNLWLIILISVIILIFIVAIILIIIYMKNSKIKNKK